MNLGGIKITTGNAQSNDWKTDNRTDWTTRQIRGSEKGKVARSWLGGVIPLAIGGFMLWHVHMPIFFTKTIPNPFVCILGLVSAIFFIKAIWETIRLKRFGDPVLELNAAPIPLGGNVEGRINLASGLDKTPEFTVTLACIRRVVTNSGKNSSTRETVLWSADAKASPLLGGILPISVAVPADQPQTNAANPWDSILWRVTVKAPFRGQAFLETYQIPVGKAPPAQAGS